MAKGLKSHQQHQQQLALLGKDLARRSGRKCELCHSAGVSLKAIEVLSNELPSLEDCVFICDPCETQLFSKKHRDEAYLRCLNHSIWDESLVVQATALALLKQLQANWASELVEQVYLLPELESKTAQIESFLSHNK